MFKYIGLGWCLGIAVALIIAASFNFDGLASVILGFLCSMAGIFSGMIMSDYE